MNTSATIIEVIEEWMQNLDVMETTRASYRTKVMLWFRWLASQRVDPRCPARRHLLAWKQELERKGRSALTVDGYVTAVRLFYKYCAARGYYSDIGAGIRSSVRYRGHRKGRLTSEEAARLLDSVDVATFKGKRDKLMLALMLLLALRTCEVERVNIEDFDRTEEGVPVLYIQRKGRHEKVEALALPDTIVSLFEDYVSLRAFRPGEADLHQPDGAPETGRHRHHQAQHHGPLAAPYVCLSDGRVGGRPRDRARHARTYDHQHHAHLCRGGARPDADSQHPGATGRKGHRIESPACWMRHVGIITSGTYMIRNRRLKRTRNAAYLRRS